ncbi:GNAT family N-acetyltransferase [Streptomyces sp. B-S-A8]|uniref:GNAT family N-acetyltransferase n=1 Tax=Streptomyces solicavernae TaxID=3043614 RepID=A0ABT6RRA1_9ACTN|nr:GNAT family N-acetyltransferase [Streptomyces sp. B-S-A8]MDI3386920.1 GNAT family N-acetyltransferase [Streptomyces sp. B-S-A8]
MICYGATVLDLAEDLVDTYAEVFSAPPWNEDEETIQRFHYRLRSDAERRPGFRAALAQSRTGIDGFALARLTPRTLPDTPTYAKVVSQLGAARVEELLVGALELDELAVRRPARPQGLGRTLLAELAADAPSGRAWVPMSRHAKAAVASYRRLGWREVEPLPGAGNGVVVFLSPGHPAVV